MPARPHAPPAPTVGFVSLGCAKNLVDSQVMLGALLDAGFRPAPAPEDADAVIVNTCAFIADARAESIDAILDVCRLKQAGPCRAVIVTGCLPQRYGDALRRSLPDVDAFAGLDALDRVPAILRRVLDGAHGILDAYPRAVRLFEPARPGLVLTGGPYAYLKIAEGCDHRCAFCAIPAIRGRRRSRPPEALVREAEALLAAGYRELNLVAQDTTSYGRDLPGTVTLGTLLRALDGIGGAFRIRILYAYPARITSELLDTIASGTRICRYLDVPIQHAHPDMLRAMRRGVRPTVSGLVRRIRSVLPDVTLRTTCLVGFPGETERHVDVLIETIREAAFDHLGVFVFSPEDGTPAAALRPRPRRRTAERRRDRVLRAQSAVAARAARALLGTTAEALLERPLNGRRWVARTQRQAPEVDGVTRVERVPRTACAGDLIPVRYTGRRGMDLLATAARS
jgi:ribosomal protein S12 methylthiotransferase